MHVLTTAIHYMMRDRCGLIETEDEILSSGGRLGFRAAWGSYSSNIYTGSILKEDGPGSASVKTDISKYLVKR